MNDKQAEELLNALISGEITAEEFKVRAKTPKLIMCIMQKFYELNAKIMPEDIANVTIDGKRLEMSFADYLDLRKRYPSTFFSPIIQVIKSACSEVEVLE